MIDDLLKRLETLAAEMKETSNMMRYVGGFNENMILHAKEMEGASNIVLDWIEEIGEEFK